LQFFAFFFFIVDCFLILPVIKVVMVLIVEGSHEDCAL